uniref:hypothetical protein n=1 Tax=Sphingomonas bacterium TaxID=1895847 RepID=UPI0026311D27|nr:hypothetical protein [Sphingomonas bacterium]
MSFKATLVGGPFALVAMASCSAEGVRSSVPAVGRLEALKNCISAIHQPDSNEKDLRAEADLPVMPTGRGALPVGRVGSGNQGVFFYKGLAGREAFCGLLIEGASSSSIVQEINALSAGLSMPLRYSTTYPYKLKNANVEYLGYWADNRAPGLNGILLVRIKGKHGSQLEIDYHSIFVQ